MHIMSHFELHFKHKYARVLKTASCTISPPLTAASHNI